MPYKTLILGGTGFIGHHIARELIEHGHAVRVLARPGGDRSLLDGMDVEIVDGTFTETASLIAALEGCDALIHTAGHYPIFSINPDEESDVGRKQILCIHEALSRSPVDRFVYVSSPSAVGIYSDGRPEDEDAPWPEKRRKSAYARVKREMQDLVLFHAQKHNALAAAPTGVFGPEDRKPTTGQLIVDVAKNRLLVALKGKSNAVSVFAVAEGVRLALEKGKTGRLYVLGQENLTISDLLKRMAEITGGLAPVSSLPPEFVRPQALLGEQVAWRTGASKPLLPVVGVDFAVYGEYMSSEVAMNELGYDPSRYPLDDAIRQAFEWFKTKGMI